MYVLKIFAMIFLMIILTIILTVVSYEIVKLFIRIGLIIENVLKAISSIIKK